MLAVTRRSLIRERLLERQSVTIAELADMLGVTRETVRRDFKLMEAEGELMRTHGGAYITDGVQNDISVSMREVIRKEEKEIIAAKCADIVSTGDSIFLDSSTTCWCVARKIKDRHITVLTTSLKVVEILSGSDSINLLLVGGKYVPNTMSFTGFSTVQAMNNYFVDKAFISCRTVSMEHGVTDSNENESQIRRAVLNQSRNTYLVVDHSKLDNTSFTHICDLKAITAVVCDKKLPTTWIRYLEDLGVAAI